MRFTCLKGRIIACFIPTKKRMKSRVVLSLLLNCLLISRTNAQNDRLIPLDPLLQNYEYPFPVKFITVSIQQGIYRMAYMDLQANQPNGKTVLLFHGKNFSGAYWKQTAEALQKNGYRVVIPYQLGFGTSSKPAQIQYSFQLLALNTKNLLDSLHVTKTTVSGHSMGGMLATRFALMFPEITEKLILEKSYRSGRLEIKTSLSKR
jgi:pimeloyl-ACP methyl ester carboxylesterase